MEKKNTTKVDNVAVSVNDNAKTALAEYKEQEIAVEGSLMSALSIDKQDELALELRELMGQIDEGFGDLTKPADIFAMGQPFYIVGATTIDDYLEKSTGELKTKHIFRLEFEGGVIKTIMQSTARPRRVYARAAQLARMLGGWYKAGPFLMVKKDVKQMQPAFIFDPQPGYRQVVGR